MSKPLLLLTLFGVCLLILASVDVGKPNPTYASQSDWAESVSFEAAELTTPFARCPDAAHCWVLNRKGNYVLSIRTEDGGAKWSSWSVPSLDPVLIMAFYNSSIGYVGNDGVNGGPSGLARTLDGGKTWTMVTNKGVWAIYPVSASAVYIVAEDGTYKSVDSGATWRKITSDRIPVTVEVQFIDENRAWAVFNTFTSDTAYLAQTTDEGGTWTRVDPDPGVNRGYLSVFFKDAMNGWVCGQGRTLFNTTDGGVTWGLVATQIGAYCDGKMFFLDSSHGVIAGQNTISR